MCLTLPGRVTQVQGALAEVESDGRAQWLNALMYPEIAVGDYVLSHANLIIAIISPEEAQSIMEADREWREALEREDRNEAVPASQTGSALRETPTARHPGRQHSRRV